MKSVKPERLNTTYACPECGGFLAVFGSERNDEWRCTGCDTFYTGDMLMEDGVVLFVIDEEIWDVVLSLEVYIQRKNKED